LSDIIRTSGEARKKTVDFVRRRNVVKEREEEKHLTTNQGVPVANNQNSLTPESTDMIAG
jgi:hypothetical protein